jgi:hypothetical protein
MSNKIETTVILRCDCKHDYQAARYGENLRVHNIGTKSNQAVCTVCSRPKPYAAKGEKS